jgi:hypothetical protein
MRKWLRLSVLTLGILASITAGSARAGQIWTDIDGDGMPGDKVFGQTSDTFLIDIWVDSQSFSFTWFQAAIEIGTGNFAGPGTVIAPCTGSFTDNGSIVLVSGAACGTLTGVLKVGSFFMHVNDDCLTCATPIIEGGEVEGGTVVCDGDVSRLENGGSVFCFTSAGSDCVDCDAPTATDETTWGAVKGLYR